MKLQTSLNQIGVDIVILIIDLILQIVVVDSDLQICQVCVIVEEISRLIHHIFLGFIAAHDCTFFIDGGDYQAGH